MEVQLGEARKVLAQVMRHKTAKLLFNVPVDPVALGLPDYAKLIKRPMDLGTVARKLDSGQYLSPEQVKKDVALVWKNCITYNKAPADEPTREACREVQELFDSLWSQAGLDAAPRYVEKEDKKGGKQKATPVEVGEDAVPEQYSLAEGSYPGSVLAHHLSMQSLRRSQSLFRVYQANEQNTLTCECSYKLAPLGFLFLVLPVRPRPLRATHLQYL